MNVYLNRPRLEHQITILRAVEAASLPFNMESWIGGHGCGTAACAFGYAALDPRFQAEGLTLRSDYTRDEQDVITITTVAQYNTIDSTHTFYPWYAGAYGFPAAEKFFDLDDNEAAWLFDPVRYGDAVEITPADVIARIEHLLAGGEADPEPVDDDYDYDYDDDNEETL